MPTTSDNTDVQKLLERIDNLTQAHDRLLQALTQQLPALQATQRSNTLQNARTDLSSFSPVSPVLAPNLPNALPPIINARRSTLASTLEFESLKKASIFTGDDTSDSESDDESFFASQTLPPEKFSETQLRDHLQDFEWEPAARVILDDLLQDTRTYTPAQLFDRETLAERDNSSSNIDACYDVGSDGAALATRPDLKGTRAVWHSLAATNTEEGRRQAVGKIVILREPSALLFATAHLTMSEHFDMDEIFRLLVDDTPSKAYMKGCLKSEPRQQRSFVFSFKYHCLIGKEREPMPWQKAEDDFDTKEDHIAVSTCSSVVALSFAGPPATQLRRRSRRADTTVGHIFDPFAPWRVLSIQCFPDWKSTVDVHDQNRHYVNGPEAFLVTLLAEYQDAQKRFMEINKKIVLLVTPIPTFMFDAKLRDKLLFEDDNYTYTRRYFWAFQTLAVMNDSIQAMISAYRETFTEEVWTGENKYIWPGTKDQSSRFSNFRKRMAHLRKQFEKVIDQLEDVLNLNIQEQKDIKSLREQLFSGTSVVESREAVKQAQITVQQGFNIKLLTLVSIFFLPLTFVTSVFGMTNMPPNDSFRPFGIVTVIICVPTYFLIGSLNSNRGMKLAQEKTQALIMKIGWICAVLFGCIRPHSERSKRYKEKYLKKEEPQVPPRQRRISRSLTTYENLACKGQSVARGMNSARPTENHTHRERPSFPQPPGLSARQTSIKFDMTSFEKPRWNRKTEQVVMSSLEKKGSDPGPLGTVPEEDVSDGHSFKKGIFRSWTERLSGSASSKSPV